ncbi:MAG: hypothetical protein ACRBDL_07320 [Alphaproteobacteria bacterium]
MHRHPNLEIERVDRKEEHIPLADKFSRYAAKNNTMNITNKTEQIGVPCLYYTLSEEGEVERSTFVHAPDIAD